MLAASSPTFSAEPDSYTTFLRSTLPGAFTETVSTHAEDRPPTSSSVQVVTGFLPAARMSFSCAAG